MRTRHQAIAILTVVLAIALPVAPAAAKVRHEGGQAGRSLVSIVNGSSAVGSTLGMVARVIYNNGSESFLCSGTVVSSNVILTAGHCAEDTETGVVDAPSNYQVTTGSQSLGIPGQVSGVTQVVPYPAFNTNTLSGDAALLVLATPTTVTPVTLASDPGDADLYDGGTGAAITGWGVDDYSNDLPSSLLYGLDVVQSADYCAAQAESLSASFDPMYQLCAVDAPSHADGTCNGDSGGPILAAVNQTWVEIGITSFGPEGCNTSVPGFFTRVDSIYSWIEGQIQKYPPPSVTPTAPTSPTPAPPVPASPTSPTPTTTTSTAATQLTRVPQAGVYRGRTTQRESIRVQVNHAGSSISNVSFGFRLRCTRHPRMAFTISPGLKWNLSLDQRTGFTARFYDPSGTQYRLAGTFTSTGAARGSLSVSWRTRRYGSCTSGAVRWSAAH